MLVMLSVSAVAHLLMVILFVDVFNWGFTGICVATSLQFVIRWAIIRLYCSKHPVLGADTGARLFSQESKENVSHQVKLGLFGLAMGVWGWWAFDIFTLIASYLSVNAISAQTILRSLGLLTFMVPVGFATAGNVLIA